MNPTPSDHAEAVVVVSVTDFLAPWLAYPRQSLVLSLLSNAFHLALEESKVGLGSVPFYTGRLDGGGYEVYGMEWMVRAWWVQLGKSSGVKEVRRLASLTDAYYLDTLRPIPLSVLAPTLLKPHIIPRFSHLPSLLRHASALENLRLHGSPELNRLRGLVREGRVLRLVAVDVESDERDQSKLLELGVALVEVKWDAQSDCVRWGDVKAEHFVFRENGHVRNGRLCPDNKDKFNFGPSTHSTIPATLSHLHSLLLLSSPSALICHALPAEVRYLSRAAPSLFPKEWFTRHPCFDTQVMFKEERLRGPNCESLSNVLEALGMSADNLHNAGNDAYYTLQVALALLSSDKIN